MAADGDGPGVVKCSMDTLPPQASAMTVQEFLVWEPGDGRAWQLVDGVPQPMSPTSLRHGFLQSELTYLLTAHFRRQGSPCRVLTAPGVQPRVNAAVNFRIPDLAVTCTPVVDTEQMLQEAVLLVEILSPSNHAETWSNVWTYTTIPSVQEIVVFRTDSIGADVLRRNSDGAWPEVPERVVDGNLELRSIGFSEPLRPMYGTTNLA